MRIVLFGANGKLGRALREALSAWEVYPFARSAADISQYADLRGIARTVDPAVVVNAAAYTNVDGAETERGAAALANALGPAYLAQVFPNARLVHYSTDFVFDGALARPYRVGDDPNPLNVYGATKLAGEQAVLGHRRGLVLRTASVYGTEAYAGSVATLVCTLMVTAQVVVPPRTVSPTYAADLAAATAHLVRDGLPAGLLHLAGSGAATWEAVARRAAKCLHLRPQIRVAERPAPAVRPPYSALDSGPIGERLMPPWQDALARYVRIRRAA